MQLWCRGTIAPAQACSSLKLLAVLLITLLTMMAEAGLPHISSLNEAQAPAGSLPPTALKSGTDMYCSVSGHRGTISLSAASLQHSHAHGL